MSDPRDRVLDHALRRLYRGDEDSAAARERARAIVRAWERGVAGSGAPDLNGIPRALPAPAARAARASVARKRWPLAALAAGLAVLAAAGLYRASRPGPAASASRPVLALVGDAFAGETDTLAAGSTLWVPPGPSAQLQLPGGAELVLESGSLGRLAHGGTRAPRRDGSGFDGAVLEWGVVRASAGSEPFELELAGVRVTLEPGARVAASVAFDAPRPAPTALPYSTLQRAFADETLGLVTLSPESGGARVAGIAGAGRVAAGETLRIALGPAPSVLPATELESLRAELADLAGSAPYPEKGLGPARERLAAQPALWLAIEDELLARLLDRDAGWAFRRDLLGLLALDEGRTTLRIARAAWAGGRAEDFDTDQIVAFAERGAFELQREAAALVTWYDEDAELDPFPAALYLALRGDDRGVRHLVRAIEVLDQIEAPPAEWGGVPRAFAAAVAIGRLGDPEPRRKLVTFARTHCETALSTGRFDSAVMLVLILEYTLALADDEEPRVSFLDIRGAEWAREHIDPLDSPEAVRARLAVLTDR